MSGLLNFLEFFPLFFFLFLLLHFFFWRLSILSKKEQYTMIMMRDRQRYRGETRRGRKRDRKVIVSDIMEMRVAWCLEVEE